MSEANQERSSKFQYSSFDEVLAVVGLARIPVEHDRDRIVDGENILYRLGNEPDCWHCEKCGSVLTERGVIVHQKFHERASIEKAVDAAWEKNRWL